MSCCCTQRSVVTTDQAPKAIGPYSVAIKAGHMVFTSGQIGLIPETGVIIEGGVEAETRQALTNLSHVLEASGTSLARVVKTTVFLRDMADFARMNAIYGEFFTENPPARSAVQAAGLPKGAAVEIECTALLNEDACDCDCDCK